MAFPVPALQAVVLPPLVVELPEDVVGREVVLDVVVRLDVELDGLEVELVDVETAGAGAGGLELHPASASRPTITGTVTPTARPVHTRPKPTVRMTPT